MAGFSKSILGSPFFLVLLFFSFSMPPAPSMAASPTCYELFSKIPRAIPSPSDPIAKIFFALESGRGDAIKIIHENFLAIAKDPALKRRLPLLMTDLRHLQQRRGHYPDIVDTFIERSVVLARLAQGDMESWKAILTGPEAAMDNFGPLNTYGTMGYLLKSLPERQKNELLAYLGDFYHQHKNRTLVQPIHVLLDPKSIYENFKRLGRSDREFFDHYLKLIHEKVFKGKMTGSYSSNLVIEIARLVQNSSLRDGWQEVNFFGSVVNGFGKPESDLDIFDSLHEDFLPAAELQRREDEGDLRHLDLFGNRRTPMVDPQFEVAVGTLLKNTPWHWRVEVPKTGAIIPVAYEHIGGASHVFSFHISKDKITLRFYPDSIRYDEHAQALPRWRYIELDITMLDGVND